MASRFKKEKFLLRKVRLFWHIVGKEKYEAGKNFYLKLKFFFLMFSPTQFGFINNISGLHYRTQERFAPSLYIKMY